MAQKDLLTRLADAGEAAIKSLAEAPGADRFLGAAYTLRDRLDELQRRVRGLEALEQRLAELERRVDELSASGEAPGAKGGRPASKTAAATKDKPARETTASD